MHYHPNYLCIFDITFRSLILVSMCQFLLMVEREHLFGRRVQSNPFASKEELNNKHSLMYHIMVH